MTRKVCKSDWDYEITFVFEEGGLKNYMENHQEEMSKHEDLELIKSLATEGSFRIQNFVYDEF
jgi:hypothetical protein